MNLRRLLLRATSVFDRDRPRWCLRCRGLVPDGRGQFCSDECAEQHEAETAW